MACHIGSNFDTGIYGLILGMSITNFGLEGQFHGEGLTQQVADTISVTEQLEKITKKFPLPMAFRLGVKKEISFNTRASEKDFLSKTGTCAFLSGYPVGINKNALSLFGRDSIFSKNPIGLGV